MNKNPARRLGSGIGDAEEVQKHPYFTGVEWDKVFNKEVVAPFIPIIGSVNDVSNFDKEFTKEQPVLTPINTVLNETQEKEFEDFEYVSEWGGMERTNACNQ